MKKRILIADADPGARVGLEAAFEGWDAELLEAARDDSAYKCYLERGPDLILIDVLLPSQGGMNLLRRIRQTRGGESVAVVMTAAVSARGGADLRSEAVERLGALDLLKKPIRPEALAPVLDRAFVVPSEPELAGLRPQAPLTRGTLAQIGFPILLQDLASRRITGSLHLRQGSARKILFLRDGEISFALSNQVRETLGRYLLSRGEISDEAYRAGLESMKQEGKKFGECLVASGVLSEVAVLDAVRANIEEKVLELFSWREGEFVLAPYADPPAELPGPPLDLDRLLWEGIRDRTPLDGLLAALAPHRDLFVSTAESSNGSELPVSESELEWVRKIRSRNGEPLKEVLLGLGEEPGVRMLYYLILRRCCALTRQAGTVADPIAPAAPEPVRQAKRRLEALSSRNSFQILEVPLDVSDEGVRQAYLAKAKEVHPDTLGPEASDLLLKIQTQTFRLVRAAYDNLKSKRERADYLGSLTKAPNEGAADPKRAVEAELLFHEGKFHARRRDWDRAAAVLQRAMELNPDEGEYVLHLGIARTHQAAQGQPELLAAAEELLRRAASLSPGSPEPYYRLGMLAWNRSDTREAAALFGEALRRRPNHLEAQRALRLIHLRAERPSAPA